MKRQALQSLCKKHGIPANLTNHEMADRLALLLKVCLKSNSLTIILFFFCLGVWLLRKLRELSLTLSYLKKIKCFELFNSV